MVNWRVIIKILINVHRSPLTSLPLCTRINVASASVGNGLQRQTHNFHWLCLRLWQLCPWLLNWFADEGSSFEPDIVLALPSQVFVQAVIQSNYWSLPNWRLIQAFSDFRRLKLSLHAFRRFPTTLTPTYRQVWPNLSNLVIFGDWPSPLYFP